MNPTILKITTDNRIVIPGELVFYWKDTCGLPMSVVFAESEHRKAEIDWIGLILAARAHDWWDYQTWDAIQEAFQDSGAWRDRRSEIENRIKFFILKNEHPKMKTDAGG